MQFLLHAFVLSIHYAYNDSNHHVEKGEGCEENKAEIEQPADSVDIHGLVHDIGPVLERHNTEQGEHGDADIAPQHRIDLVKQCGTDGGIDIEDDEQQQQHIAQLRR